MWKRLKEALKGGKAGEKVSLKATSVDGVSPFATSSPPSAGQASDKEGQQGLALSRPSE